MNRRFTLLLIPLVLLCFAFSQARATCQRACLSNQNTALGEDALLNNTTGVDNTAIGFSALLNNINGYYNTAIGFQALLSNNGTVMNTAIGNAALQNNTAGNFNTATGVALESNTTGTGNTATGVFTLKANTTGSYNTAIGFQALNANTIGSENIALGNDAGINLVQGSRNIYIGNRGGHESNTIRIGKQALQTNTYIAGISGVTVPTGLPVIVDADGHLGTTTSSARFKEAIEPMEKASEAILSLKPVTFHYKKELDPEGVSQFGLVAEQVEKVNPELVAYDDQGKPYTVRYEAVNAMLLNEFLKEHRRVEQQRKDFQAALAQQQKQIDALTANLQKVSAQLEVSKAAPHTVVNNP